jgi:glycerol-3-phosphate cytidylyltransferase-like family protein
MYIYYIILDITDYNENHRKKYVESCKYVDDVINYELITEKFMTI